MTALDVYAALLTAPDEREWRDRVRALGYDPDSEHVDAHGEPALELLRPSAPHRVARVARVAGHRARAPRRHRRARRPASSTSDGEPPPARASGREVRP
jgi:hypothetical protein